MSKLELHKDLKNQASFYRKLIDQLMHLQSFDDKIDLLYQIEHVNEFFSCVEDTFIHHLPIEKKYVLIVLVAINQDDVFMNGYENRDPQKLLQLIDLLLKLEKFYDCIGGILGYHTKVLELLIETLENGKCSEASSYYQPHIIDIIKKTPLVSYLTRKGIESLTQMGEMYPIGGAGDRLQLLDRFTGEPHPVALLPFLGRSLLEGLIRDVQAKEFLYYKLYHEQIVTPIALMTSEEKHNRRYIENLLKTNSYFGRAENSYKIFDQPLVPVVSVHGTWVIKDFHELALKPGGHGVIWKQALDEGIFDWFQNLGKNKLLIRQINNPIGSTDYGVLSTIGYGVDNNKSYGVLSCKRLVNSPEGMNVLCERVMEDGIEFGMTNIEYTEFKKKGIEDLPIDEEGMYSAFPTNTNILFVDLEAIKKSIVQDPIPGTIINMKTEFTHINSKGFSEKVLGGRLESMMQSIADCMFDKFNDKHEFKHPSQLRTFITYAQRHKTLSVTKNSYKGLEQIEGTPLHAHHTVLANYHELLTMHCETKLPPICTFEEYALTGPNFLIDLHPAIGPLWDIISQKVRKCKLHEFSELKLEIADVDIRYLELYGSLIVEAKDPLGPKDEEGVIQYNPFRGKCFLHNVQVKNYGINRDLLNCYWSNDLHRKEALMIILYGNAEFYAKDVTFEGNYIIEVENGYSLHAYEENGKLKFYKKPIQKPSWDWSYTFDEEDRIVLDKRVYTS